MTTKNDIIAYGEEHFAANDTVWQEFLSIVNAVSRKRGDGWESYLMWGLVNKGADYWKSGRFGLLNWDNYYNQWLSTTGSTSFRQDGPADAVPSTTTTSTDSSALLAGAAELSSTTTTTTTTDSTSSRQYSTTSTDSEKEKMMRIIKDQPSVTLKLKIYRNMVTGEEKAMAPDFKPRGHWASWEWTGKWAESHYAYCS